MTSQSPAVKMERIPRIPLLREGPVIRDDFLVSLCRGKKVLHVGCTDTPYTQAKFQGGLLLHEKIRRVAEKVVGIDLDGEAVAWLQSRNIPDLYVADATRLAGFLQSIRFEPDLILAGEVVEHLSRPGDFLEGIRGGIPDHARLVVTVPNAYAYFGILQMVLGYEKVHPEHVAYYSFGTLRELLTRHGYAVQRILPCRNREVRALDKLLHFPFHVLLNLRPHFATGYIAIAGKGSGK
jgi:hypothetical protein